MRPEADSRDAIDNYRHSVRTWLASQAIPRIGLGPQAVDQHRQWHRRLYEAGLLGVDWPVDCGGQGLSWLHQMVVMEELARADAPFPLANVSLYVVGPTVVAWGTAEQKRRYLPPLLRGDEMWCQGFSEPGAGSDLASLRTRATLEGDHFVVHGQKVWTTHGHYAELCALMVRTGSEGRGTQGLSYLILDMRSPGVEVRPIRQITGEAEFNEVFLSGVRVPAANLIGEVGQGWKVAMRSLASERGSLLVQRKAEAQAMFHNALSGLRALGYGMPQLPLPPEMALRVGHARMQLAALDATVRAVAARMQEGELVPGEESLDKLLLTEVEQEIFTLAFDVLGPWRQVPDSPAAEQLIRDYFYSLSRSISAGTTQIQRNIVAQRVLKLPRAA